MLAKPLKLPKITIILGNATHTTTLAKALVDVDDNTGIRYTDAPLLDATIALLFNNDYVNRDRITPDALIKQSKGHITVSDFTKDLLAFLISKFGPGILGRIAVSEVEDDGNFEVFDRMIFLGLSAASISPFVETYGKDSCLVIQTGPLQVAGPDFPRTIWLPIAEIPEQLKTLERELGTTVS